MFDYSQMTAQKFEELAKVYLETEFPTYKWEITERSGDGNRDVICRYTFVDAEIEYWAEAKFTANPAGHSLKKGQLDPTLISAFLSPKPIAKIQIISNNNLPENYYYRIEDFRIKTSIGVQVVERNEFEQWLLDHSDICDTFKITQIENEQSISKKTTLNLLEIKSALITSQRHDNPYTFDKYLNTDTRYALYLRIDNHTQKALYSDISVYPQDTFVLLNTRMQPAERVNINVGISTIKMILIGQKEFSGTLNIILYSSNQKRSILCDYSIKGIKCLYPKITHMVYAHQGKVLVNLTSQIKNSRLQNEIIYIFGSGATGKTYLLSAMQDDLNSSYLTHHFALTGNMLSDSDTFCRFLLYVNMGDVLHCSLETLLDILYATRLFSAHQLFLETLIRQLQEGSEFAVQHLYSNISDSHQFVFPNPHICKTIIFLDDLHKANYKIKALIGECLKDFSKCNNNQIIVCSSREHPQYWFDSLNLDEEIIRREELRGLSRTDKLNTVKYYFPEIETIDFDPITNDLLTFSSITSRLLQETHFNAADKLSQQAFIQKRYYGGDLSNIEILKGRLKEFDQYNEIIELVYALQFGITYTDLLQFFPEKDIDFLLESQIIVLKNEYIIPAHDLYVEAFFSFQKISSETVKRIILLAQKHTEQDYRYYALLLTLGIRFYIAVYDAACQARDYYFEKTMLYPAFTLASAIVKYRPEFMKIDKKYVVDLFVLASSSFYEKKYNEIIDLYQKVISYSHQFQGNIEMDALALHAKTEIINQKYWALEVRGLKEEINKIENQINLNSINLGHDQKYALLNCLNRRMVIDLLMDQYDTAKEEFYIALNRAKELGVPEYEGFAHMDYARGLYCYNLPEALLHMEIAQRIFSKLSIVERRKRECECEIAYIHCLQNPSRINIDYLISTSEILKEEHYWELYAKAQLKIAAILLLTNRAETNNIRQLLITSEYILPTEATVRFQMINAHIKSLYYAFVNNLYQANQVASIYNEFAKRIGPVYKTIGKHNLKVYSNTRINCACRENLSIDTGLLLDPRIW